MISTRMGRVTGHAIAGVVRHHVLLRLPLGTVVLLLLRRAFDPQ